MDTTTLHIAVIVIQAFLILFSNRGDSVMLMYILSTIMCLMYRHKSMRMEQHSVLEEGKCANSCVHECKYLIIIHSAGDHTK